MRRREADKSELNEGEKRAEVKAFISHCEKRRGWG